MTGSAHLSGQMEVTLIEVCHFPEAIQIGKSDSSTETFDETFCLQRLEHPIDVHRCKARGVTNLLLAHRQGIPNGAAQPLRLQPNRKFAQEMSDPFACGSLANIQHPFAVDRSFDQDVGHDGLRNGRPLQHQLTNGCTRDNGRLAACQGLDIVVGVVEKQILEAQRIPRHVD